MSTKITKRRNKSGRIKNMEIRKKVKALREANYSYAEIAELLGFKSRQLARYYALT